MHQLIRDYRKTAGFLVSLISLFFGGFTSSSGKDLVWETVVDSFAGDRLFCGLRAGTAADEGPEGATSTETICANGMNAIAPALAVDDR